MISADYPEFLAAVAAAAAALTGLLFVALSVAPRRPNAGRTVIQQVRAAAALLAFVNTLAVALFGLVPGNAIGYPAVTLGVIGILFTAAGIRSIVGSPETKGQRLQQLGLVWFLSLIFGTELVTGIMLIANPHSSGPLAVLSNALVASMLVGIARAWELVGDRDTGILSSIAVLTGHRPRPPDAIGAAAVEADDDAAVGRARPSSPPGSRETSSNAGSDRLGGQGAGGVSASGG